MVNCELCHACANECKYIRMTITATYVQKSISTRETVKYSGKHGMKRQVHINTLMQRRIENELNLDHQLLLISLKSPHMQFAVVCRKYCHSFLTLDIQNWTSLRLESRRRWNWQIIKGQRYWLSRPDHFFIFTVFVVPPFYLQSFPMIFVALWCITSRVFISKLNVRCIR
jgi:hypothetical protein